MRIWNPPSNEHGHADVPRLIRTICHIIQLFSKRKGHNVILHSVNVKHRNLIIRSIQHWYVDRSRSLLVTECLDATKWRTARKQLPPRQNCTVENDAADGRYKSVKLYRASVELFLDTDLKQARVGTEKWAAVRETGRLFFLLLDKRSACADGRARRCFRGVWNGLWIRVHWTVHWRVWSLDIPIWPMVVLKRNEGGRLFSGEVSGKINPLLLLVELGAEITCGNTTNYGPIRTRNVLLSP